jgi:hypothetical protein
MVNLNDTTPVAPTGGANVKWQEDAAGNVSAYTSLAAGGGAKTTVTPVSHVATIDASLGNSFLVNVNDSITTTTITNPTDGQEITILWQQDGSGHSIVLPTNMYGGTAPSTVAGKFSCQKFTYNVGNTNWYAIAAGVTGM